MTTAQQLLLGLMVAGGVFGVLIGSFLNVVVYRVPAGLSVVRPASTCPQCGHGIRRRDNVPVLSWVLLRGRCRDCATPISARYPLVELLTGALFFATTVRFAPAVLSTVSGPATVAALLELVAFLYLMAISVALAFIDLDVHRLPDALVLPSYPVLLVLLGLAAGLSGDWGALLRGVIGMVVLGAVYLGLALGVPGGMGLGDVKLAGLVGLALAYLGWGPLAVGAFGAFLLGGIFAAALIAMRRAGRKSGIPFGPWMLAGLWLGVFFGPQLWHSYSSLIGLG
jgi:leader peptidase (prepilin peptidase)/N-methyltransferase